jgi:hypothetical protein
MDTSCARWRSTAATAARFAALGVWAAAAVAKKTNGKGRNARDRIMILSRSDEEEGEDDGVG